MKIFEIMAKFVFKITRTLNVVVKNIRRTKITNVVTAYDITNRLVPIFFSIAVQPSTWQHA